MPKATEVAIVGGGVIGCSIAYQLSKKGVRSTVFEKGRVGSNASEATAGIIGPLWYINRAIAAYFALGMHSLSMFPPLAPELLQAGVDPEFQQNGILRLAFSTSEMEALQQALVWQTALEVGVTWLEPSEVLYREPSVNPEVLAGVYSPLEGCVRGQSYVDSLAHSARLMGADIYEDEEVLSLETDGTRVTGVSTPQGTYPAGHTVLAAGPWTGTATGWPGNRIPVRPVKGQRVLLRKEGLLPKSTIHTIVPQKNGDILVGATREEGEFDQKVTADGIGHMLKLAKDIIPDLKDAEFISATAGVRPASPDGVPILGPLPGWSGVSVASGHDHAGVMLSPATGHLMADFIVGGDPTPLEAFSMARFDTESPTIHSGANSLAEH